MRPRDRFQTVFAASAMTDAERDQRLRELQEQLRQARCRIQELERLVFGQRDRVHGAARAWAIARDGGSIVRFFEAELALKAAVVAEDGR